MIVHAPKKVSLVEAPGFLAADWTNSRPAVMRSKEHGAQNHPTPTWTKRSPTFDSPSILPKTRCSRCSLANALIWLTPERSCYVESSLLCLGLLIFYELLRPNTGKALTAVVEGRIGGFARVPQSCTRGVLNTNHAFVGSEWESPYFLTNP